MLQKVAQDRLDKVLEVIKTQKFRFANKEISEKLGIGKGTVSDYLNGAKPMSEPFYESFMAAYANEKEHVSNSALDLIANADKVDDDKMEVIKQLVQSGIILSNANNTMSEANKIIAEANRTLANNNEDLIEIIKDTFNKPTPSSAKDKNIQYSQALSRTFDQMAEVGVGSRWGSFEEGQLFLDNLLASVIQERQSSHNSSQSDIQHKA